MKVNVVKLKDQSYPESLKQIKGCPEKIYCRGRISQDIFGQCLAVVGARKMTRYGAEITSKIVLQVAQAGITIISGFMYGIDAAAHQAALDAGGVTVAVMPCGIERIHPEDQDKLYFQILENKGLVISEYPKDSMPMVWTYPQRNRIVAGIAQATLVVEAALDSGSMITANLTRKFQRKLFAIPGPLTSKVSLGTAELIKQGADIVTKAKDILDYFNLNRKPSFEQGVVFASLEKKILETLEEGGYAIDPLSRKLQVSVDQLGTILSCMLINGLVEEIDGKYEVIKGG